MTPVRLFGSVALTATLAAATPAAMGPANIIRGCVDRFDAAADYFPDKASLEDASNFAVEYHRSYKVVTVREPYPGGRPERDVLVQCGAPRPALTGDLASAAVVTVPITSLFSASSTHVPPLVDLGRLEVLRGVDKIASIVSPQVLAHVASAHVVEFSPGSVIDAEKIVAARPSVLMTSGFPNSAYAAIRAAGVPVVANAEWLEPTALGRAEWVKYEALYLNEERQAQSAFARVKAAYAGLKVKAAALPAASRPLVMTGRATRGTFTIAGGHSYVAALIADGGGRYVWADNPATGSTTVDLEAQLQRARDADVWINGGGWKNRAAMLADEPRYAEFRAFRSGQIWVYERLMNDAGGNDYWTRSITRPDLLLADLVKIFHPDLDPAHAFEWYMQVPGR
jgi:iron complex transport system substrate-binding protein